MSYTRKKSTLDYNSTKKIYKKANLNLLAAREDIFLPSLEQKNV